MFILNQPPIQTPAAKTEQTENTFTSFNEPPGSDNGGILDWEFAASTENQPFSFADLNSSQHGNGLAQKNYPFQWPTSSRSQPPFQWQIIIQPSQETPAAISATSATPSTPDSSKQNPVLRSTLLCDESLPPENEHVVASSVPPSAPPIPAQPMPGISSPIRRLSILSAGCAVQSPALRYLFDIDWDHQYDDVFEKWPPDAATYFATFYPPTVASSQKSTNIPPSTTAPTIAPQSQQLPAILRPRVKRKRAIEEKTLNSSPTQEEIRKAAQSFIAAQEKTLQLSSSSTWVQPLTNPNPPTNLRANEPDMNLAVEESIGRLQPTR